MAKKDQNSTTKVAIYLRVSTDEQVEKYGRESQLTSIKKLIESRSSQYVENGLELAGEKYIYSDDGVSGTIPIKDRPQFSRMMEDYDMAPEDNKPFNAVAVYKIDRLARKLKILTEVIEYFEGSDRKIKLISVNENIDTSTPFGRAMLNIMGVIAELEIETTKERTQNGRNASADQGTFLGTNPPLGYIKVNKKLHIQKEEMKIVINIFRLFTIERKTPAEIATILKNKEILTPAGWIRVHKKSSAEYKQKNKPYHWTDSMVRKILNEDLYTGKYYYNKSHKGKRLEKKDWILSKHKHPIIIDDNTFDKAQNRLAVLTRIKNRNKSTDHIYPLQGLLVCDACKGFNGHRAHWNGSGKIIKSNKRKTYSYQCGRKNTSKYSKENICKTIPLPADKLESYVIEYTKNLLSNPIPVLNYQAKLRSSKIEIKNIKKDIKKLEDEINLIPIEKERYLFQHKKGFIDNKTLENELNKLNKKEIIFNQRYNSLRDELSNKTSVLDYEEPLKKLSKKYKDSLDKKLNDLKTVKEILNYLFEEIIIFSRPRKNSDIIAGPNKMDQLIPNRIHMRMRLPQEILAQIPTMPLVDSNEKEKSSDLSDDNSNIINLDSSLPKSVSGGR